MKPPTVGYVKQNGKVYIRADNLVELIKFMQDGVDYDPGLSALKTYFLEFQLKVLTEGK